MSQRQIPKPRSNGGFEIKIGPLTNFGKFLAIASQIARNEQLERCYTYTTIALLDLLVLRVVDGTTMHCLWILTRRGRRRMAKLRRGAIGGMATQIVTTTNVRWNTSKLRCKSILRLVIVETFRSNTAETSTQTVARSFVVAVGRRRRPRRSRDRQSCQRRGQDDCYAHAVIQ